MLARTLTSVVSPGFNRIFTKASIIQRLSRHNPLRQCLGARKYQEARVSHQQKQRRGGEEQASMSDGQPERRGGALHLPTYSFGAVQDVQRAGEVHAEEWRSHCGCRDGDRDSLTTVRAQQILFCHSPQPREAFNFVMFKLNFIHHFFRFLLVCHDDSCQWSYSDSSIWQIQCREAGIFVEDLHPLHRGRACLLHQTLLCLTVSYMSQCP